MIRMISIEDRTSDFLLFILNILKLHRQELMAECMTMILAHTLPFENQSVSILRKCGFQFIGEILDTQDGIIRKWGLKRDR